MSATFTEEQQELKTAAAKFLEEKSGSETVRELMESDQGFDEAIWKQMAELGWLGLALPEEYGGVGLGFAELAILMEEMGKHLLPAPYLSSAVLAARTILHAGSDGQKTSMLPGIADGTVRGTLAFMDISGRHGPGADLPRAERSGTSFRINGSTSFVLDGHTATSILVVASTEESALGLFAVAADQEAVSSVRLETIDGTRKQSRVDFSDAEAEPLERGGDEVVFRILDEAAVALSAEAVGTAQAALDIAVEYAKTRIQFGRPIGSFQGVKHKCADMLTEVEMARSAAYYGAWAAAEEPEELPFAACIAKAYCSDAVFDVAARSIQILGGIGFTWEHDAHLYLRRAKSQEIYLGDASYHRELLATRLGI